MGNEFKELANTFNTKPGRGKLLVADPYLPDQNFKRTVVLLAEYREAGAVGFVINRRTELTLDMVLSVNTQEDIPLYMGGPVQKETLHILHCDPNFGKEELKVAPGIYWGADFDTLKSHIEAGTLDLDKFRFFLGYSGWGKDQLDKEVAAKSWIPTKFSKSFLFSEKPDDLWAEVLESKGGNLKFLANSPSDPILN